MPDEDRKSDAVDTDGAKPAEADKDEDAELWAWVRNAAKIATVVSALVGLGFTAYQLKMKADSDERAASLSEAAEAHKLKLGEEQLKDQGLARDAQAKLHDRDIESQSDRQDSDHDAAENNAKRAAAEREDERLTATINSIFKSSSGGAEGDLAALFEHLDRSSASTQIVQNVVLARLEDPHSREEIDIGFGLLEHIGLAAIDTSVQANRSARAKYDDCLFQSFYETATKAAPTAVTPGVTAGTSPALPGRVIDEKLLDAYEYQTASGKTLDHSYVFATINKRLATEQLHVFRLPTETPTGACPAKYVEYVIKRSTIAIKRQLDLKHLANHVQRKDIDLSETYLSSDILGATSSLERGHYDLILNDAYVGVDRFFPDYLLNKPQSTLKVWNKADTSLLKMGPANPSNVTFDLFSSRSLQ